MRLQNVVYKLYIECWNDNDGLFGWLLCYVGQESKKIGPHDLLLLFSIVKIICVFCVPFDHILAHSWMISVPGCRQTLEMPTRKICAKYDSVRTDKRLHRDHGMIVSAQRRVVVECFEIGYYLLRR